MSRLGHDVAMLQVVSPEETTFPYRGDIAFQDLESGDRRLVDAGAIRQRYRTAVSEFLARCRTLAQRDGIDYALLSTDAPPERALRGWLLRRDARQSAGFAGAAP